ncbi:CHAP domain-containing protein [Brevibacillus dissolubilis]|uniref:CHAP domain-containing protein n=1 Tax=Brevibacillus dissolubilis TaxID=1844116 RepID=UPI00159B9835|nr:CHAP domain-containing protein [Brevibacillus dissolubilis]
MKKIFATLATTAMMASILAVPSFAATNNQLESTQSQSSEQQVNSVGQDGSADHSYRTQTETFGIEVKGTVETDTLGIDDYPYKYDSWTVADPWLFYKRECVSFVAWRMNNDNKVNFHNYMTGPNGLQGHWGNANQWDDNARNIGYAVNKTPAVGAIAQWNSGGYGHVAYVQSVSADRSTITIEEYNYNYNHNYNRRTIYTSSVENFIHVKDLGTAVYGTVRSNGIALNVRSGPSTAYAVVGTVADGSTVRITCQKRGQMITGSLATTDLWDYVGNGYVSDAYVETGSNGQVAPTCQ